MKTKRNKKPTNKDFQAMIQDLMYRLTAVQSQTNALTEIFSDFLDFNIFGGARGGGQTIFGLAG